MIEIHNSEFDSLCLYAFRYVKGRSTYAVADLCGIIKKHKEDINKTTLKIIHKELVNELIERNHSKYSHECDERKLRELLEEIEDELG